ncbi:manganese-dependent inorganic pyrophosphatase [Ferrimonas lipolytica]|uniref:inorganic diphosphatase n=1 Tax=Ferrimonas lipolytica TaxID=2724191 RepID=A0A6H1UBN3_9GAMM|nr:manganese-dependent inorganic pyrophosphatase [Ferrimonas lipolytica]QIZ76497.1 manganese-dependent inorganic pyrophosphatase [Ferrimonas lipolytica]
MIHVFGHLSPDSDSICSAVIAAHWLNHRGMDATAFRPGEASRETQFIFEAAGLELPPVLDKPLAGEKVYLVDFCEQEQGPSDLPQAHIVGLVDHHRMGTLQSHGPLEAWMMPLGSTASVLHELYQIHGAQLTQPLAVLMLAALLSDTVGLKSPTTTARDVELVDLIAPIAQVDVEQFTADLLVAKTDLNGMNANELLDKDVKSFEFGGKTLTVGQLELADFAQTAAMEADLQAALEQRVAANGKDVAVLMLTNIRSEQTRLLVAGPAAQMLIDANPELTFDNCLSRKKQMLPWLNGVFTG